VQVGRRDKVIAALVLAACAAALAWHAVERRAADPCEAHPATYTCAMFAQPEWLTRRVYAGRSQGQPTFAQAPASAAEPLAVSAEVVAAPIAPPTERSPDGV
jgi:hypothetical protein